MAGSPLSRRGLVGVAAVSEVEAYLKAREASMIDVSVQLRDLAMRRMIMESCIKLMREEYERTRTENTGRRRVSVPAGDLVDAGKWLHNYMGQLDEATRKVLASDFVQS